MLPQNQIQESATDEHSSQYEEGSTDELYNPSHDESTGEHSSQSLEELTDEQSLPSSMLDDDGTRRCRLVHSPLSLRHVGEALKAAGRELDAETVQGLVKPRRVRNKGQEQVRRGRGLGRPAAPKPPADRPRLKPVGSCEFSSSPQCTKVKTTIRLLTVENMPGPYRSYNMFPVKVRLNILRKFLQRYTWAPGEAVGHCLEVYEAIAANLYTTELTEQRSRCKDKYGEDKAAWKEHPPSWCKNVEHWKGLCDIWATEKWEHQSSTNRQNMMKAGPIIHHVGGSRSMFQHMQKLVRIAL